MGICQSNQRREIQNIIKNKLDTTPSKVNSRLKLISQFQIYTFNDLLSDQNRSQFQFDQWELNILYQEEQKILNKRYNSQLGATTEELDNKFQNFDKKKVIHLIFGEDEQEKHKLIINFINLDKKLDYNDTKRYTMNPQRLEKEFEGSPFILVFNIYEVNDQIFLSIEQPPLQTDLDCYRFRKMIYDYFYNEKVEAIYNIVFVTPVKPRPSINNNEKRIIQSIFEIFNCKEQLQFLHIILTNYDRGEKIDSCITSQQSPCYQFLHIIDQQQQIFFCNNNKHEYHDLGKRHYEDLKQIWRCLKSDHLQAILVKKQDFQERCNLFKTLIQKFNELKLFKTNLGYIKTDFESLQKIFDKEWKKTALDSLLLLTHDIIFSENNTRVSCQSLIFEPLPDGVPQYLTKIIEITKEPKKVEQTQRNIENEQNQFQIKNERHKNDIKNVWQFKTLYDCFLQECENQQNEYIKMRQVYIEKRKKYHEFTYWPQNQITVEDIENEISQ